jgi:opacity protein-like surface antigen
MHRFLGRFVIGAGALLIAATAHAQNTAGAASSGRPFKLGGALGATVPLGDFGDGADLGFHLGGLIEYKPSAIPVNLRGEITYHRNGLKSDYFSDEEPIFDDVDGSFSMLNFVGNALFPFGDPASTARPYAIGGLGLYRMKASAEFGGVDISDTQTKFGINVGGGFTFNLSGFETFVEARFHSVFTEVDNTNFIPLSFGFKF